MKKKISHSRFGFEKFTRGKNKRRIAKKHLKNRLIAAIRYGIYRKIWYLSGLVSPDKSWE
jgi:hypothetical protein